MNIIKCEDCNEEMHPFASNGLSGYSCDSCGWSIDDDNATVTTEAIGNQSTNTITLSITEYEQLKKDAERYRFIRDVPWRGTGSPLERVLSGQRNAIWDESIDEAIAKDSHENN
jgi:hypothetical protein